jgi:hypothetical protein
MTDPDPAEPSTLSDGFHSCQGFHADDGWRRWTADAGGWYLSYGLLGVAAAGLTPILLPLIVCRRATATDVGLVMAALNIGGLVGPVAGTSRIVMARIACSWPWVASVWSSGSRHSSDDEGHTQP